MAAGLAIFLVAVQVRPELSVFSCAGHLMMGVAAFPAALVAIRFFDEGERLAMRDMLRRVPWVRGRGRQAPSSDDPPDQGS